MEGLPHPVCMFKRGRWQFSLVNIHKFSKDKELLVKTCISLKISTNICSLITRPCCLCLPSVIPDDTGADGCGGVYGTQLPQMNLKESVRLQREPERDYTMPKAKCPIQNTKCCLNIGALLLCMYLLAYNFQASSVKMS